MWVRALLILHVAHLVPALPSDGSCTGFRPQSFMDEYISKVQQDMRDNSIVPPYQPGGYTVNASFTPPRCTDHFTMCSNRRGAKCFTNDDICHKGNQCTNSQKDEYKCDEALCFFDKEDNVALEVPATDLPLNRIQGVDTKACAKVCLDIPKCMGFQIDTFNLHCNLFNEEDMRARRTNRNMNYVYTLKTSSMKKCATNQFTCSYTECIPLNWVCDGNIDCSAGTDEAICEMSSTSFQVDNETNTGYYHDIHKVTVTYGACAFLCSEDKDSCRGFWYSHSRQLCLLSCDNSGSCPTELNLDSTEGFNFYRRTPLTVMQGLKVAVQILKHVISNLPAPEDLVTHPPPPPVQPTRGTPKPTPLPAVAPHWYDNFPRLLSEVQSFCGLRNVSTLVPVGPLVSGGKQAGKGQFPWQVQIQKREGPKFLHICGGSIITKRHILTAAHCTVQMRFERSRLRIVVGSVRSSSFGTDGRAYSVKRIRVHQDYELNPDTGSSNEFDVALVEITEDIQFSDDALPVCLPQPGQPASSGSNCLISGFGATTFLGPNGEFGETKSSEDLLYATFNLLPNEKCQRELRIAMPKERLCVGGAGATCEGDSGGPFVCTQERFGDRHFIYGIVHVGAKNCKNNKSSALINVAQFTNFIVRQVGLASPIP